MVQIRAWLVIVVALLLTLGVLIVFAVIPDDGGALLRELAQSDQPRRSGPSAPAPNCEAVTRTEGERSLKNLAPTAATTSGSSSQITEDPDATVRARWSLTVRVRHDFTAGSGFLVGRTVHIEAGSRATRECEDILGKLDASGTCEVDISSAIAQGATQFRGTVEVDSAYLPCSGEIHKEQALWDASRNTALLRLELVLIAAGNIAGFVRDQDGAGISNAIVLGFTLTEDGRGQGSAEVRTRTGADGSYDLRIAASSLVRIVGIRSGFAPGSVISTSAKGRTVLAPDILLSTGGLISGRIEVRDRQVGGWEVTATRTGPSARILTIRGGLAEVLGLSDNSVKGVVQREIMTTRTDDGGRFRLEGLENGGMYEVRVTDERCPLGARNSQVARAPESSVEFTFSGATVQVHVVDNAGAIEGADVLITSITEGQGPHVTRRKCDIRGSVQFCLASGACVNVKTSAPGYKTRETAVSFPTGPVSLIQHTVHLERHERAALRIHVSDAHNGQVAAAVRIVLTTPDAVVHRVTAIKTRDQCFDVFDIGPGRYDMSVSVKYGLEDDGFWVPCLVRSVSVEAGATREFRPQFVLGGRIRIDLEDRVDGGGPGEVVVRGPSGKRVACGLKRLRSSGGPRVLLELTEAVAPGAYRVEVIREGRVLGESRVVVVVGRWVVANVVLGR